MSGSPARPEDAPAFTARQRDELAEITEALMSGGYDGTEGEKDSRDSTFTDFGIVCGIAAVLLAERDEREQALRRAELQLWELDKVARSECDDPFAVVKTVAFGVRMGITEALAAGGVRSADAGSGGETA